MAETEYTQREIAVEVLRVCNLYLGKKLDAKDFLDLLEGISNVGIVQSRFGKLTVDKMRKNGDIDVYGAGIVAEMGTLQAEINMLLQQIEQNRAVLIGIESKITEGIALPEMLLRKHDRITVDGQILNYLKYIADKAKVLAGYYYDDYLEKKARLKILKNFILS